MVGGVYRQMKIASIDIMTVVVPTIPGRVHSASFGPAGWDQIPKHIIKLNTDEGIYGLGETSRGSLKKQFGRDLTNSKEETLSN